jgi:spectinomycin phosphotransferase
MYAESVDVDHRELVAVLEATWGLRISTLRYEPVGFGSHHYIASASDGHQWFVTVDDLAAKTWLAADVDPAFDALEAAFQAAVVLRRANLEFIHAPIEGRCGRVLARVGTKYAVSVFTFIDGSSLGEHRSREEQRFVLQALGRMHAAGQVVSPGLLRRDTLEVPFRGRLLEAFDDLHSTWASGPYSEATRRLLLNGRAQTEERLARYDELVRAVSRGSDEWVVTHGEPHGANLMRTGAGTIVLVDWDTVAVGPRERDLWMVEPQDPEEWAAYTCAASARRPDPEAMQLYRLWWELSEIASYTNTFRSPHVDDANTQVAWRELQEYVLAAQGGKK